MTKCEKILAKAGKCSTKGGRIVNLLQLTWHGAHVTMCPPWRREGAPSELTKPQKKLQNEISVLLLLPCPQAGYTEAFHGTVMQYWLRFCCSVCQKMTELQYMQKYPSRQKDGTPVPFALQYNPTDASQVHGLHASPFSPSALYAATGYHHPVALLEQSASIA